MTTESKLQRLTEIYPASARATMPLGVRVNDMVYTGSLAGIDLVTGEPAGDLKRQIGTALQHMRRLVERAGGSIDNIGRAVGFCTRVEDRDLVDQVWMDVFPDPNDKPAFKVLLAELPEGQLVRIDALALLGETRTRIDIPNVVAHDPTVKIGNWVFSSRCHGNDQTTGKIVEGGLEAEARQTLENLCTLVTLAGGTPANITQITTFGHDDSYLEPVRRIFEQRFPDASKRPELNQVVNFVSARMQVAMEMVAVL
jgi:2-iminobutanoate/2-iminopropanoate deaminase